MIRMILPTLWPVLVAGVLVGIALVIAGVVGFNRLGDDE